eukprot:TRINITY_DN17099_c2_g1_i1.p1 TRINITY_DN17099_c2_g1~~TRINITY_DN17099_c2_g1_i1.p1  ORF type:complete len:195 (-),score=24.69 TRINITY_DN17099_c2_g1_i1:182-766(-)
MATKNASRTHIPKAFNPAGWDAVKTETIKKEQKLGRTSSGVLGGVYGRHGGHPPCGWAWFTDAGFCDAMDREPIVRSRFPQQPVSCSQKAAGHDTIQQKALVQRSRFASREQYLDRSMSHQLIAPKASRAMMSQTWGPGQMSTAMSMSMTFPAGVPQSAPSSPSQGQLTLSRSYTCNRTHMAAGIATPGAVREI